MKPSLSGLPQSELSATPSLILRLPPLPLVVVYEDDYAERIHKIRTTEAEDETAIFDAGEAHAVNFKAFEPRVRPLVRAFLLGSLLEYSPNSVVHYYYHLKAVNERVFTIVSSSPEDLARNWAALTFDMKHGSVRSLKTLLLYQCRFNIGLFDTRYSNMVSGLLEPKRDPYAVVRAGDCFISVEEEAALVHWIDAKAKVSNTLSKSETADACLVVCSYQFGMRPKQLGVLRKRDVEVRVSVQDSSTIVTLTFRTIKLGCCRFH